MNKRKEKMEQALNTLVSALEEFSIDDDTAAEIIQDEANDAFDDVVEFMDLGDKLRFLAWAEAQGVTKSQYVEDIVCIAFEGQEWPEDVKAAMRARHQLPGLRAPE